MRPSVEAQKHEGRDKLVQNVSAIELKGVGKQVAKYLAHLGIQSIQDVLFHFPLRYQDRTHIFPIRQCKIGEDVVIEGVISAVSSPLRGRTKLLCELRDETGKVNLRFFKVFPFQKSTLSIGVRLRCFGTLRLGQSGLEIVHPEFHEIDPDKPSSVDQYLTPFYPSTEGLSQYVLRKITSSALLWMQKYKEPPELLPAAILSKLALPALQESLQSIHRPPASTSIQQLQEYKTNWQRRLIFEELLAHRLSLLHVKNIFQAQKAAVLSMHDKAEALLASLPFSLTPAQQRVMREIEADLGRSSPMLRLVQGDVGSGKTIVAALAILVAVSSGYQAAMMAPTELLAEQHYRVFFRWLEPLGVKLVYLSGNVKGQARKAALDAITSGEAQVVIGTHALFQEEVKFHRLALVVADEQHRFGVHQRAVFRDKGLHDGLHAHQLIMTATPIPRTLAMSFYADLDVSVIDELPPGRTPVMTNVIASSRRDEVIDRIRDACDQGRQVYWVCPLIEESEALNCQAATTAADQLREALPHLSIGLVHGQMSAVDKNTVMQSFQRGDIHLLVATTVIEVGVDVPNASVMIVENAERLGLSQLHQLRGRVGRGSVASYCLLMYQHPLSEVAKARLSVMRETTDGFKIARRDLELRGPGEVLGTRQTGEFHFHVADLLRDNEMLDAVQHAAALIMRDYPQVIASIVDRWIGKRSQYAKA